jgi:hypothetical protein
LLRPLLSLLLVKRLETNEWILAASNFGEIHISTAATEEHGTSTVSSGLIADLVKLLVSDPTDWIDSHFCE